MIVVALSSDSFITTGAHDASTSVELASGSFSGLSSDPGFSDAFCSGFELDCVVTFSMVAEALRWSKIEVCEGAESCTYGRGGTSVFRTGGQKKVECCCGEEDATTGAAGGDAGLGDDAMRPKSDIDDDPPVDGEGNIVGRTLGAIATAAGDEVDGWLEKI